MIVVKTMRRGGLRAGLIGTALALALATLPAANQTALATGDAQSNAIATPAAAPKTLYTCGMHPQVVQDHPGNCYICGMKLVPMDPDKAEAYLAAKAVTPSGAAAAPAKASSGAPAAQASAASSAASKPRKILSWRSSMNPAEIHDKPGKDSMGMDLVPVYAENETEMAGETTSRATPGGPTIRIDPVTEQNMGLRLATVQAGPMDRVVRAVGVVAYDEAGLWTVTTKVGGWVERLHVARTGDSVAAGQPLFDVYSPELYSAQEELIQSARDARGGAPSSDLAARRLATARDRLRLFDIDEAQIDAILREGKPRKALTIAARRAGTVTERGIAEGDNLMPGQAAYKLADLSTVWVVGQVFERDLPLIHEGQAATMTLDYLPGRSWAGRVARVYPYLKDGAREVQARMEFANPDGALKPGMYATLTILSRVADRAVQVPAMAVIDTGERQVVFVQSAPGKFQARRVRLGPRGDDGQVQVLSGLAPGERVVTSGQFLLDSESSLREATLKMLEPSAEDKSETRMSKPEINSNSKAKSGNAPAPMEMKMPM